MKLFTNKELCEIFNVGNATIVELVRAGKLPAERVVDNVTLFSPDIISKWVEKLVMNVDDKKYLEEFKRLLWEMNPAAMQAIKEYGEQFDDPQPPKRYYLVKEKSKKFGFLFYVRYLENGRLVPSRWCTHTNDREAAKAWAIDNRERLLALYFNRDTVKKTYGDLYTILKKYYAKDSMYLQIDAKRGRRFSDKSRVTYHNFIINRFIPYLRKNKIKDFEEIDTPLLSRFQNNLLADRVKDGKTLPGVKPKTVNHYISHISLIFDHLIQEGHVKINPCKSLISLKRGEENVRGCYEIPLLKGVFNKTWKDQLSYLLCLVIYTTGMRNSEIERMKVNDLITIDKVNFIDIPESKTKNGIRIVPMHDIVYKKLAFTPLGTHN